jgi:hypothetical protein
VNGRGQVPLLKQPKIYAPPNVSTQLKSYFVGAPAPKLRKSPFQNTEISKSGAMISQWQALNFYILRHTCLTRWAPHIDVFKLAYLAGHRDIKMTYGYIHPQEQTVREGMDNASEANSRHTFRHTNKFKLPILVVLPCKYLNGKYLAWCARHDSNMRPSGS